MPKLTTKTKGRTRLRTAEDPGDIHDQLKGHLETISKSWFKVAVALSEIQERGLYVEKGYASMEEYCESELDYEYRSLRFRIQMGDTIRKLGITEEQVEGLTQWTKFKEIMSLFKEGMTSEEIDGLLSQAKDLSVRQIQDLKVQRSIVSDGRKSTLHRVYLSLIDDQFSAWTRANQLLMDRDGDRSPGQVLETLCLYFEAHHSDNPQLTEALKEYVKHKPEDSN